jgi:hypothetical protein
MIRALCAVLLLAASASAAPLALPSFESSARDLQASLAAARAASIKTLSSDIGPRLDAMAWDLRTAQQDVSRLRGDLRWLMRRVGSGRGGDPRRGPGGDVRWDLQRFNQNLADLSRNAQWRLNDLYALSAQAPKDPELVAHVQRLIDSARWLQSETNQLTFDARFDAFQLMTAGYALESMDLDRNSRDLDRSAQDLQAAGERLLAKVR